MAVTRRRIEVLVDRPLVRRIVEIAREAGVPGYTLLPTLGGEGEGGPWSDDMVSGAQQKVLFLAVMSERRANDLVKRLTPLLQSHGLALFNGEVQVVRPEKFD